jgi:hypothetical protein
MYQRSPSHRTSAMSLAGIHHLSRRRQPTVTTSITGHHHQRYPPSPTTTTTTVLHQSWYALSFALPHRLTTWIWRRRRGSDSNSDNGYVVTTKVENGSKTVDVVVELVFRWGREDDREREQRVDWTGSATRVRQRKVATRVRQCLFFYERTMTKLPLVVSIVVKKSCMNNISVVIPTTWLEITISLKYNCQLYLIKNTHNNIYADDRG